MNRDVIHILYNYLSIFDIKSLSRCSRLYYQNCGLNYYKDRLTIRYGIKKHKLNDYFTSLILQFEQVKKKKCDNPYYRMTELFFLSKIEPLFENLDFFLTHFECKILTIYTIMITPIVKFKESLGAAYLRKHYVDDDRLVGKFFCKMREIYFFEKYSSPYINIRLPKYECIVSTIFPRIYSKIELSKNFLLDSFAATMQEFDILDTTNGLFICLSDSKRSSRLQECKGDELLYVLDNLSDKHDNLYIKPMFKQRFPNKIRLLLRRYQIMELDEFSLLYGRTFQQLRIEESKSRFLYGGRKGKEYTPIFEEK